MVAHARRTNHPCVPFDDELVEVGDRKWEDGVTWEWVHDNEFEMNYWLPLHPLTLYGEAMRDLQQLLNDRRKLDAQTSATDDTQAR